MTLDKSLKAEEYHPFVMARGLIIFSTKGNLKAYLPGKDLSHAKWQQQKQVDLELAYKSIRLPFRIVPGFDLREFPLVVGVDDNCSFLLLANLQTEEAVVVSRIIKKDARDCICDLILTYKLKPEVEEEVRKDTNQTYGGP